MVYKKQKPVAQKSIEPVLNDRIMQLKEEAASVSCDYSLSEYDIAICMLSDDEIRRNITDLANGWELKDGKIVKSFQFSSFMKAIEFVSEIAKVSERLNHHPIITINWKSVKLSLKSFDIDAITKRDIGLAKEIEKVVKTSK